MEDQTDDIAHTIQDLLQAMRQPSAEGNDMQRLINNVMNFVENIIFETRSTFDITPDLHPDMRADCDDILELLEDDRDKLLDMADQIITSKDRGIKQQIANCSYEIAKVYRLI